jgi:hypothetical protein
MDPDTRSLVKALKDGYTVTEIPNRLGRWMVLDPHGRAVSNVDRTPIVLGKTSSPKSKNRLRAQLEAAGAIERKHHKQPRTEGKLDRTTPGRNPLLMAQEVLLAPYSTATERGLAKEVMRLHETLIQMRALARALSDQLKEANRGDL